MPFASRWTAFFVNASSHDFFPGFSARARRTLGSPVGVLAIALVFSIVCGLFLHPRLFALSGGIGLILAAGICWPWLLVRGVRVRIAFEHSRATEGELVGVTATATNHLPIPAWGLIIKGGKLDDESLSARLAGISPRTQTVSRWSFQPALRGEYPRSQLVAATGFPFGIWEPGRTVHAESLLVWPRTVPVGPAPISEGEDVVEGNVTRNKVGSIGEVLGARPYRRGDSPRRIHWAQSARHDRLIVCELQSHSRAVILLILDTDPAIHTKGPNGSREWAIRVFASLAKGWLESGAQVGALWDGFALAPSSGQGQLIRILDALSRLTEAAPTPMYELLRSPIATQSSGVRVGVTSDEGLNRLGKGTGIRWAVLPKHHFGEIDRVHAHSCDEGTERFRMRPWIEFDGPSHVPDQLRHGWPEARHGS